MKSFICRGCLNLVTVTVCTSVDIGVSANLDLVDKFCYLGDMLTVGNQICLLKTNNLVIIMMQT